MPNVPLIQCRNIARRLLASHRWQLLSEDELTNRLWARREEATGDADQAIQSLAKSIYSEEWYQACAETERQEQAYSEVIRFLYDYALYKCHDPERAADIAQEAARRVYEGFAECRAPGLFLNFLFFKLRHAETYSWRDEKRNEKIVALSLDEIKDAIDGSETDPLQMPDINALSPEQNALCVELRRQLFALYENLLQQRPRAVQQVTAVLYKFHAGYADEEIAKALATNIDNIYTLRNRGLQVLRENQAICQLLKTIVETCTESANEV